MTDDPLIPTLQAQARACEDLGSPFTGAILRALADLAGAEGLPAPLGARLASFSGDIGPSGHSLPLRLAGALHALALMGRAGPLDPAYAAPAGWTAQALRAPLDQLLRAETGFIVPYLDSPPQTNEMRRSAVLIAAGHWLTARFGLPLVLSELGASAGLNLVWDAYALQIAPQETAMAHCAPSPNALRATEVSPTAPGPTSVSAVPGTERAAAAGGGRRFGPEAAPACLTPDWRGAAPDRALPQIRARAGVDLNPLDPVRDRLRILSYIWADQTDRLVRTRAGLDHLAAHPAPVVRGDAADWLEARLATPQPGACHMVFHTIAWQYFPPEVQARCTAALARAGAEATCDAPLAHFGMEADGQSPGAGLRLTLWPGGQSFDMGRADFHGRWIDWRPPV